MPEDRKLVDNRHESIADYHQEEIVPNQTNIENNHELTADGEQMSDHSYHHKHVHSHHHENHVPRPLVSEDDQTAHKILNLLSEIGHSNIAETPPFMEKNFLPCKFCTGPIYVV